ncbi:MAG TPA: phosphate ABC transporter permease subunit PstC [Dehalococcoidia bacterium]|nr:phosphate ABC transporter permease subunit PstC [Dehalococcoidia bacterium]
MWERAIEAFIALNGILAIVILMAIFALLVKEGVAAFSYTSPWDFLLGRRWYPVSDPPTFGILGFFVATLLVTLVSAVIAVPIGLGCAAYLSEVAPSRVREIVKPLIELLAGVPSVVMGFIGLIVVAPLIRDMFHLNTGLCGLSAAIMLAFMKVPVIVSISEDSLRAVPQHYREASYALGATKWQTIIHVCFPGAISGITAAVMLGLALAIGETMAVLMVAGGATGVPSSPVDPMRPMTATIAAEINNAVQGGLQYRALFAIGLLLFVMTFLINVVADWVMERQKRKFLT